MIEKVKLSVLAADFKMASKDLTAIIKDYTGAEKKSGASVAAEELNIVFDALTQKNQVKSFEEYFATGEKARAAEEEARKADKERKLAEQMAIFEQLKAAQEAEMAAKKAEKAAKAEPKKTETKVETKTEAKPEAKKAEPKKEVKKPEEKKAQEVKEHKPSDPKPFAPRVKDEKKAGAAPNRGPVEIRHVDTRVSNVDMERYNEKYENIAPANSMKDNHQRKQKINQKSQNYRRQEKSKKELEAE
ncbi:MAG: hypothetical protein UHY90_01330, partial [Treponema sp.]|nr:hypothetical protein [Treponema sp.]